MKSRRGFTIGELLIVVAIVAVLVGVSVPVLHSQKLKAQTATDVYNAKVIARKLIYYYSTNSDAYQRLLTLCSGSGSYCGEVSVLPDGARYYAGGTGQEQVVNDLIEAVGSYTDASKKINADYKCQNQTDWVQYCVAVTTWTPQNKPTMSEIHILYTAWGLIDSGYYGDWTHVWNINNQSVNPWGWTFRDACGGNQ